MSSFDSKLFLANVSQRPGVYRMLAADGEVLYVGKARNLKNRLTSYFVGKAQAAKTMAMVAQIANVEVTVTASETEALLLEYNLIKRHKPRFNVALRDDKSFPYLHISTDQDYPRISFYRGARKLPGRFFGPYPNARATRETSLLLQKLFLIRPCSDTFFQNRSRPCLQHQIKRCSGPCVGLISKEDYAQDIADAIKVLEGRGAELLEDLGVRMEQAAGELQFERAARLRDQIHGIKAIHSSQSVTRNTEHDIDAVALESESGEHCVSIVFVRGGRNLGSNNFFPRAGLACPIDVPLNFWREDRGQQRDHREDDRALDERHAMFRTQERLGVHGVVAPGSRRMTVMRSSATGTAPPVPAAPAAQLTAPAATSDRYGVAIS